MTTNKNVQKYPKLLANAETSPRNKHKGKKIINGSEKALELKFIDLNWHIFEIAGVFPYLFDTIGYACTHYKDKIQRIKNDQETHYRVAIPWNFFIDFAIDGFSESNNKKRLIKEIYKLIKNPPVKVVPLDLKNSIRTQLLRIDISYKEGSFNKRTKNLKNVTHQEINGVIIEFYKPMWRSLFNGKFGNSWFLVPKAFNARLYIAIDRYKDLEEFTNYGILAYLSDYRRLFLYMNLHDNKRGNYLIFNDLDLVKSCIPSLLDKDRKGNDRIKNWFKVYQFIQKGLRLLCKMSNDGLLSNVKFIPSSIYYDKPKKQIKIGINRKNNIVEFKDNAQLYKN